MLIAWATAAWETITTLPVGLQVLFWSGIALAFVPLIIVAGQLVLAFRGRKRFLEAYDDREALNRARGGIKREISRAKTEAWIAWQIAGTAPQVGVFEKQKKTGRCKVTRAIFMSPCHPALDELASMFPQYTVQGLREDIEQATRMAFAGGADVRWTLTKVPLSITTIIDPQRRGGYARVEVFLHKVDAPHRPSVIVPRWNHTGLFERIECSFEYLWQQGTPPPDSLRQG